MVTPQDTPLHVYTLRLSEGAREPGSDINHTSQLEPENRIGSPGRFIPPPQSTQSQPTLSDFVVHGGRHLRRSLALPGCCARGERPCRRAAEQRDERAPSHDEHGEFLPCHLVSAPEPRRQATIEARFTAPPACRRTACKSLGQRRDCEYGAGLREIV
jgi:hypothetical protein